MKKKTILLLCLILGISHLSFGQQRLKGYQVILNDYGKKVYNITYTRSFYSGNGLCLTIYKLYNTSNKHFITIEAKHQIDIKKITVDVVIPNGGVFARINTEEYEYESPSLEPFGIGGTLRVLTGDDMPSQLALKFMSKKYESVKVIMVNGTRPGDNTFVNYVLSKEL